jgi:methylisocitrate lyase
MTKAKKLRLLLADSEAVLMPVAHDALSAKLIEQVGFSAFSIGGFGVAASSFAKPDNGSVSFNQLKRPIKYILAASNLPALVDADTGYGGPNMIAKVIRRYEAFGAAAIFIEDQVWPKRCGHVNGHQLISIKNMQAKIKAALAVKKDKNLIIMARTDAISAEGSLTHAIKRAKAYLSAGAEAIFIEAPRSKQELKAIPQALPHTILLANMMEGGKTPLCSQQELASWGFKLIAYPILGILSSSQAIINSLHHLQVHGHTKKLTNPQIMSFSNFKQIIGL